MKKMWESGLQKQEAKTYNPAASNDIPIVFFFFFFLSPTLGGMWNFLAEEYKGTLKAICVVLSLGIHVFRGGYTESAVKQPPPSSALLRPSVLFSLPLSFKSVNRKTVNLSLPWVSWPAIQLAPLINMFWHLEKGAADQTLAPRGGEGHGGW